MVDYNLQMNYRLKNGEDVTIAIDEDELSVIVFDSNNNKIGNVDFIDRETHYHIKWMYLDQLSNKYLRNGIGRQCLKYFREVYMSPITASDDNGIPLDDGSHLTGDAPGFIAKMKEEGIVQSS